MKLYEIADSLANLDALIDLADGELSPEALAELDALEGALDAKVERIVCLIRERQRHAEAAAAEAARLRQVHQTNDRAAQSLKQYLVHALQGSGRTKAGGPIGGARIQANPPAARCRFDGLNIPAPYRRESVSFSFDARAALADHKAGVALPEGVEVVHGQHLRLT